MAKKKIIYFASSNKHKLKEIKNILKVNLKSRNFVIKNAPEGFSVNENGKTFLENAYKKASALSKTTGHICFADDSGIEVYAMDKKPGIKSARFFKDGKGLTQIINKVKKSKNKKCCFTCAIVVTDERGKTIFKTKKSWHGKIANEPSGKNGFGYDPIFIDPLHKKTAAELSQKQKNELSHRSKAIKELGKWLKKQL